MCAIKITRDRLFHRAAFLPTDAQLGIQIDATWTSPGYARATKVPSSATRPDKGLPFSRILSVVSVQVATRRGFAFLVLTYYVGRSCRAIDQIQSHQGYHLEHTNRRQSTFRFARSITTKSVLTR